MAALALFARGCPPGCWMCGDSHRDGGQTEGSAHPVPPLAPAASVPFGIVRSRSWWGCCERAAHPLQPGCSRSQGLPAWHHLHQAVQQPEGWHISQQSGVSRCCVPIHTALCQQGGHLIERAVPSVEDRRKHPITHGVTVVSPCRRKQVPGHQMEHWDGSPPLPGCFLGTPSGVTSLQTWELPETGSPSSSLLAEVRHIWRPH